ncbi:MAG: hypothetical protein EA415_01530 [Sphaerobacteraceae bacterium]|nr:MAG: hypothetical protein EA415_01530 [Sphaerobacteraceae bacterium]
MFLQRAREISRFGERSMDRRRFLTLATGAIGVGALAPFLAACGGDDDGDDAAEAVDDGDTASAEVDDSDDDGTFPDDFPDNIPLPDDWEITSDTSRDRDGSREISIRFESYGDRMGMIETYDNEIPAHYDVSSQSIDEDTGEATWIISNGEWEWGSVVVEDPWEDDDADFQVSIELHEHMR